MLAVAGCDMRRRAFLGALACGVAAPTAAWSRTGEIRALSISNDYIGTGGIGALPNAPNDGLAFCRSISELDTPHSVHSIPNAHYEALQDSFNEWIATSVRTTDILLLHYAGHGVQIHGQNFMLTQDGANFVRMAEVFEHLRSSVRDGAVLVFVDACRNNPFVNGSAGLGAVRLHHGLSRTATPPVSVADPSDLGQSAFLSTGLGDQNDDGSTSAPGMDPQSSLPDETMVFFAAQPGRAAADNDPDADPNAPRNSPFTSALVENLTKRIEVQQVMTNVTSAVRIATGTRAGEPQTPMRIGSCSRGIYLAGYERPEGASFVP